VVTLARMNQQREMKFLIKKALVEATFTHMDIANPELVRITGAQEPTGEPWFPAIEHAPKKRRSPRPGGHAGEGGSGAAGRHKPRHKPRTGGSGSGGSSSGGSSSDRPKSSAGGGRGRAGGGSGRPSGRPGGQSGGRPGGKPAGKSGPRTGGKSGGSRPPR
jgi:hypothetical protein